MLPQNINTSSVNFSTSLCNLGAVNGRTGDVNNNTVLAINMQGMMPADIVTIYSLLGSVAVSTGWQQIGTTSNYKYTVNTLNTNATSIFAPLPYTNPTYISLNRLTNITVSRISNTTEYIYAILTAGSTPIPLCPITIIS